MRLLSLTVRNYRVIRSACFEVPDAVIGIIGPNGAGKSTLVEAVAWSLYGNAAARSGKEQIKSQTAGAGDTCEVTLEFEAGREHFKVSRKLVGAGLKPEALLERNGVMEAIGVTETDAAVARVLGLDFKAFQTSFLARQDELNALATLPPAKRKDHLAGMLGVDRLERAMARIKQDQKAMQLVIASLDQQVSKGDQIAERVAGNREHVEKLAATRLEVVGAHEKSKRELDKALFSFGEHDRKRGECSVLRATLDAEHRTAEGLSERQRNLAVEIKALTASQQKLALLEARLVELPALELEFGRLQREQVAAARRAELERQRSAIAAELSATTSKMKDHHVELAAHAERLATLPSDAVVQAEALSRQLESAREQYAGRQSELAVLTSQLQKTRAQLDDLEAIGPDTVCDRCHRPFGADLPKIRQHLHDELTGLREQVGTFGAQLEKIKGEGAGVRAAHEAMIQKVRERETILTAIATIERLLVDLKDRSQSTAKRLEPIDQELSDIGEVTVNEGILRDTTLRVGDLNRFKTERDQCVGALTRLPAAKAEMETVTVQMTRSQEILTRLNAELAGVGFDQGEYDKAKAELSRAQAEFERRREALVAIEKEVEVRRAELQKDMDQLKELETVKVELNEKRDDVFYRAGLHQFLSDFRVLVIGRIRPRLGELASTLLDEMTAGRYPLAALDENYNLQVWDGGEYFDIDRFSGGEKDLASLCLRLAISEALTEAAGLDRSFVILDEVFGSQDEQRKELILTSLANLKQRFPQMLLITHLDEIKDRVERLIQVTPTGHGWSEVRIDGALAK